MIGGIAASPLLKPHLARAQPEGLHRLAVVMGPDADDPHGQSYATALVQGLAAAGWREGNNLRIDWRWTGGTPQLYQRYAAELVALKPDVILAHGSPAVAQFHQQTRTIPIVCASVIDPVGLGFVNSLSHPDGNVTGFTFINPELIGKWTGLLRDAAPGLTRAALLYNPGLNPWYEKFLKEISATPHALAVEVVPTIIETVDDLRTRVPGLAGGGSTGLIIGPEAFMVSHMHEVAALATENRLPGVSVYRQFADEGGLMSYGPSIPDLFNRAAGYIDRILRGEKAADLPVQQPTKFDYAINLKAAKALGLSISPSLMATADEVIE